MIYIIYVMYTYIIRYIRMHVYCFHLSSLKHRFAGPLDSKKSQGQVQTRQVQITLGNGGALDLEIEDEKEVLPGNFHWNIHGNQDLISTRVIAVYGYIDV